MRRWVKVLLKVLVVIALILLASDSDNIKVFILVHLVSASVIVLGSYVLLKYGQ